MSNTRSSYLGNETKGRKCSVVVVHCLVQIKHAAKNECRVGLIINYVVGWFPITKFLLL